LENIVRLRAGETERTNLGRRLLRRSPVAEMDGDAKRKEKAMETEVLERRFAAIGARVKLAGPRRRSPIRVGVGWDGHGEYFDVRADPAVELEVVDVDRPGRHLLLLAREGGEKSKFLCGHDERHWFVAAVPEDARGVTGVRAAKAALQPELVRTAVERARPKDRFSRRNAAYVRQGEWFFVPVARLEPPRGLVRRREPLTRGRGTPHVLELAYRRGGEVVWVNERHPRVVSDAHYRALTERERRRGNWRQLVRDPELFAKGAVRHPDHATIVLPDWHRVVMNTEQGARAMRHVAFLD
jgi:hypothetical protein